MQTAKQYAHPYTLDGPSMFNEGPENAATTSIKSLRLKEQQNFYYLFDFGDERWHEITVEEIDGNADKSKYPRIIEKNGKSPPQYQYDDEEEEDEEWDEFKDDTT